jgi:hypothetical protein
VVYAWLRCGPGPTHAFANVGCDRLCRIAQLRTVNQSKLSAAEQPVDFVGDRACGLENTECRHTGEAGAFSAKAVTEISPSQTMQRILTLSFTPLFTSLFTRLFTSSFTPFPVVYVIRTVKRSVKRM